MVSNLLLRCEDNKYQSEWGLLSSLFVYETCASPLHIRMQNRAVGGSFSDSGVEHVLKKSATGPERAMHTTIPSTVLSRSSRSVLHSYPRTDLHYW
jgi:hypothetical protein